MMRRNYWLIVALLAAGSCGDGRGDQSDSSTATDTGESSDETTSTSSDSSGETSTSDSTDGTSDDTDGSTGETDETGTASDTETDTGEACGLPECKLNGAFGLHVRIPVSWPKSGVVAAGNGEVRVTLRLELGTAGTNLSGTGEVCEFLVPWYLEDGGNEKYELDWRDELFPASIPDLLITGETCGSLPEQTFALDPFAVQIGVDLPGPINGAWPDDVQNIPEADHDSDGRPAFSVLGGPGNNTWAPPLDDAKIDRTHIMYIASRMAADLVGTVDDCDGGGGDAEVLHLDVDAVACRVCQGDQADSCTDQAMDCTGDQLDYLNAFAGKYQIGMPTFSFARVEPNLDCEAIATYF